MRHGLLGTSIAGLASGPPACRPLLMSLRLSPGAPGAPAVGISPAFPSLSRPVNGFTLPPRGARVSAACGAVILPLLLQESGEVVRPEPGVEEHLAVVLGDPAPQLGVDRDLALARLR